MSTNIFVGMLETEDHYFGIRLGRLAQANPLMDSYFKGQFWWGYEDDLTVYSQWLLVIWENFEALEWINLTSGLDDKT